MSHVLESLVKHMEWADALVGHALERADGASIEAVKAYAHLVAAEEIWLARTEGRATRLSVQPEITLAEARAVATQAAAGFRALAASPEPTRTISYRNLAGTSFETPLDQIITHVCLHGAYHRGQVSLLLRRGNAEPAPTDYIAFARLAQLE